MGFLVINRKRKTGTYFPYWAALEMKPSKVILIECVINHVALRAIDQYNSVASDFRMIQIKYLILVIGVSVEVFPLSRLSSFPSKRAKV
jgi:hypothetical protein